MAKGKYLAEKMLCNESSCFESSENENEFG